MPEKPPSNISENAEGGEYDPRPLSSEEVTAKIPEAMAMSEALAANIAEMRDELKALEEASLRNEDAIAQKKEDIRYAEEELALIPGFIEESQRPADGFIPTSTKLKNKETL